MNDIKFACPHCSQHIACDGDYAELPIECPSCGGTMAVPRLMAAADAPDAMIIVASTTLPLPRPTQKIPSLDSWRERRWAEQLGQETEETPVMAALWLGTLFGTVVLAFMLITQGHGVAAVVSCLVLGGALTGFIRAKGGQHSVASSLLSGVLFAIALVVLVPVLALGILFVGCTACAR